MVRHRALHQLDAEIRLRSRALSGRHDRRAGRADGEVGSLRRALQGLLSGICPHPAREARRRLFGQGRARALPHLRERRSGLALDPEGPLRRDRARRIRGDERGGAHVPLRPRAGHAQHGDLRHDGREPPRPDPALLPARILRRRTGSSTGRTRPTTPTNGRRSRRATPSTTCSWRAAPPRSR